MEAAATLGTAAAAAGAEKEKNEPPRETAATGTTTTMDTYNDKYQSLVSEYKEQILRLDVCPLEIASRLEDEEIISKMDLQYINSLTLRKWQMETLYEFLVDSRCDQLNGIKVALKHYNDGSNGLFKVFEEISIRGQHFLRNAVMTPHDNCGGEGGKGETRGHRVDPKLPLETWLPYQLYNAAYEGNENLLVEAFAHVTSLQMLLELMEGSGKKLTEKDMSPLHVTCGMGRINVDFLHIFAQLIQMLVNSEAGTGKPANMANLKSTYGTTRALSEFQEFRKLEDFLNLTDSWGETALHWAGKAQAVELAKYLYGRRADLFIENKGGESPMEILYEFSPAVVLWILDDHVPPIMSTTQNEEREEEDVNLDIIAVTGCQTRAAQGQSIDKTSSSSSQGSGGAVAMVETQLLAQMVLGKMERSSKKILPHVLVKTFLDEKWKKLVAPVFILTMIYILFHLLHTVFLIQVFIVAHPFPSFNETGNESSSVEENSGSSKNTSQDFYNYLLGNWHSGDAGELIPEEISTVSQQLAIITKVTAILMVVMESFEIWATALCVTRKREGGLKRKSQRVWVSRRKMDLTILIILTSIYDQDTWRVLVAGMLLLPLYIFDWIVVTSNSKKERISGNSVKNILIIITSKLIKILLNVGIIVMAILSSSSTDSTTPVMPYSNATWITVLAAAFCILIEVSKVIQNFLSKFFGFVANILRKFGTFFGRRRRQSKRVNGKNKGSIPLMSVDVKSKNYDDDNGGKVTTKTKDQPDMSTQVINFLVTFWTGTLAYLTNLENAMQLMYLSIMIFISDSVHRGILTKGLYRGAAVSVVLAWILILLQIGHIYGLGKYIHMLRTVVKSFLAVMGTYLSLLVAFSVSFSIIFPHESRFESLPSSFFRVISMMAGELNYDDVFHPDSDTTLDSNAFPYATQLLHLVFVLAVVIVLINLLIGLTVSDIQKIQEKSDVIYRSVQVERLYIMEMYFQIFSKICSLFSCFCCPVKCSTFNVLRESSTNMPIQWNKLTPALQAEFHRKRTEIEEEACETDKGGDLLMDDLDDPTKMTNLALQISALFQDRDKIENFPLHWLFALTSEVEAQEKLFSLSHKNPLTANSWNRNHLLLLSKYSLKSLNQLTVSLEMSGRTNDGSKILSECSQILFDILVKCKDTLVKLQVDWNALPLTALEFFPDLNQLETLVFINNGIVTTTKDGFKICQKYDKNDEAFDFYKKFPKVNQIEILGSLSDLQEIVQLTLVSKIFQKPHSGFKRIKCLKLVDNSVEDGEDEVILPEDFKCLSEMFPKISRLEVTGGVRRFQGKIDFVPQFWPKLKMVQVSGELWIKGQAGQEKIFGFPDDILTPSAGRNLPVQQAEDGRSMVTLDESLKSGGLRSRITGRLRSFWSRPVEEQNYLLKGNGMGNVLIINNVFDDPGQSGNINYLHLERKGATEDGIKMDRLFRDLNFRTRVERNVNSGELAGILQDFKSECVRYAYHSCFIFVLTYGGWDSLLMNDLVSVDLFKDIVYKLASSTSSGMSKDDDEDEDEEEDDEEKIDFSEVPKVFFIQSSQFDVGDERLQQAFYGSQVSIPATIGESHGVTNTRLCHLMSPLKPMTAMTSAMMANQKEDGALFIEAIDRVFRDNAANCSLKEMMQMVQVYLNEKSVSDRPLLKTVDLGFSRQYRFSKVKGRKLQQTD